MNIDEDGQVLLMILEQERVILPVAGLGFRVAQTSQSELNRVYGGALVVSKDGESRRIKHIEVKGLWGPSIGRKLISALFGGRHIDVTFTPPLAISLDEFKALIIRFIGYDNERGNTVPGDPYLPQTQPLERVFEAVRGSGTFSEVFECINTPDAVDCLDVL